MYLQGSISHPFCRFLLNESGDIIEFESTIEHLYYNESELIGVNWFDFFVDKNDSESQLLYFKELLEENHFKFSRHSIDLRIKNGCHLFIDFIITVLLRKKEKLIELIGFEHYTNNVGTRF